jgi:hypothetical protein
MHSFWARFILPLVMALMPRRILEVGAEFGWNTEKLLEYCRAHGAHLDVVDPAPHPVFHEVLAKFGAEYTYFPLKSLDALVLIAPCDLVLLDGDHNWFTVYNELSRIFLRAAECGVVPPVVLLHDMGWPYARRDMYYDPAGLRPEDRQPYAYCGIVPGQSELSDLGLNGHFANAMHEGGPCNGVRTGVEDFVAASPVAMKLHLLPFFNGLGVLVPEARRTAALDAVIEGFYSRESLLESCAQLEAQVHNVRTDLAVHKLRLTERSEALSRARATIAGLRDRVAG